MIRVFPRRTKWTPTDELAFIGDPPLFIPKGEVFISVTFTWDIQEANRLYMAWSKCKFASDDKVHIGGPAYGDPGYTFSSGVFIKQGVTFTSRGCIRNCPFCLVPQREGKLSELPIKPGNIIGDNNLLACSRRHIEAVFDMLSDQSAIVFSGGLDARLLKEWHVELLHSIKLREAWFACDMPNDINTLSRIRPMLDGFPMRKLRCYVLIGYGDESLSEAEDRLQRVFDLGFLPFAMLYKSCDNDIPSRDWRNLQRKWCRPAATISSNNHEETSEIHGCLL